MASIAGRAVLLMGLVMGTPVEPGWGEELQAPGLVRCQEMGSRMSWRSSGVTHVSKGWVPDSAWPRFRDDGQYDLHVLRGFEAAFGLVGVGLVAGDFLALHIVALPAGLHGL